MGSGYRWIGMSEDRECVTIRRFRGDFIGATSQADLFESLDIKNGVVLDVETTGVNSSLDHIIEIGIRKFTYNGETGQILDRLDGYGELQDPGIPIPEVITKLTGINDAMVQGRSIDWSKVNEWISQADLVLAHNASFDRPFIEKHCAAALNALWGCTFKQIDWHAKGFPTAKLEILSIFHGFFVDAHRALEDSDALLHLLTFPCPTSASPYLKELLASAHCKWMRVLAKRSPFEKKDLLKGRRYRWDQNQKLWYRDIPDLELADERTWLAQNVYNGTCLADIQEIAPTQRFRD